MPNARECCASMMKWLLGKASPFGHCCSQVTRLVAESAVETSFDCTWHPYRLVCGGVWWGGLVAVVALDETVVSDYYCCCGCCRCDSSAAPYGEDEEFPLHSLGGC